MVDNIIYIYIYILYLNYIIKYVTNELFHSVSPKLKVKYLNILLTRLMMQIEHTNN
jgi:hypothetical protein